MDEQIRQLDDIARRLERLEALLEVPRPTLIGARAYNSGDVSVPNTALTILDLDSENFDSDGIHSLVSNPSRLTVPAGLGGTWLVGGCVQWDAIATGRRITIILHNGTTRIAAAEHEGAANAFIRQVPVTTYELAAGDYVQLQVFQSSGGAMNAQTDANTAPVLWMCRLAGLAA